MKTIQTKSGEILLVEEFNSVIINGVTYTQQFCPEYDLSEKYEFIGKFSELTDEVFEEFVELVSTVFYKDYIAINFSALNSAKLSFQSLCKSQGIEDDLDNYLIIKKL